MSIDCYCPEHRNCYECTVMYWGKPNYPVPAIRQHFEFGWSLSKSAPVLMHCVQGVYD